MKLYKGLKEKNRIVGELKKTRNLINKHNSHNENVPCHYDAKELMAKEELLLESLIVLKSAITVANVSIYPKIERMSELKSKIEFLKGISTKEGKHNELRGYGSEAVEEVFLVSYNEIEINKLIDDKQLKINELQDEVDEFNATTSIDI